VKWEADHPIFAPFSKDAPELQGSFQRSWIDLMSRGYAI